MVFNGLFILKSRAMVTLALAAALCSSVDFATAEELYSDRPDILSVAPEPYSDADVGIADWDKVQEGYLVFLAQVMTFFPEDEIYFLARDIEYVYDLARILYRDDPEQLKRFHVVPISNKVIDSSRVTTYLEQEGLTGERLQGRAAVFIDSCCAGTIPAKIQKRFEPMGIKVRGMLIRSSKYPSSSLFSQYGTDGSAIENHSHYTNPVIEIRPRADRGFDMVTTPNDESTRSQALKIMSSLRYRNDTIESREKFYSILWSMRRVFSYVINDPSADLVEAVEAVKNLVLGYKIDVEGFLDDATSLGRKGYATTNKDRIAELLKFKPENKVLDDEFFIKRFATASGSKMVSKLGSNGFWIVLDRSMKILANASVADLRMSKVEYKRVVDRWLTYFTSDTVLTKLNDENVGNFLIIAFRNRYTKMAFSSMGGRGWASLFYNGNYTSMLTAGLERAYQWSKGADQETAFVNDVADFIPHVPVGTNFKNFLEDAVKLWRSEAAVKSGDPDVAVCQAQFRP